MIKEWIRLASITTAMFFMNTALLGTGQAQSSTESAPNQLEANRKLVLDFWRVVIEARDLDAAELYVTPISFSTTL